MPRDLSTEIMTKLAEPVTAPGYLITISAGGAVIRYSSRGTLTWDGELWTGGGQVSRQGPTDWSLSLPNADNAASALVLSDLMAQAAVAIAAYLGHIAPVTVVPLFQGFINQVTKITPARVDITLTAASLGRSWLPDVILAPPLLNYLPPAGTAIAWGDKIYYLEPAS